MQSIRRTFKRREGVYFTSLEAARNFLTRERLTLLQAIRTKHPQLFYELAKPVDRNLKNVQQNVRLLERHSRVRFIERRGPKEQGQNSRGFTRTLARVPFSLFEASTICSYAGADAIRATCIKPRKPYGCIPPNDALKSTGRSANGSRRNRHSNRQHRASSRLRREALLR